MRNLLMITAMLFAFAQQAYTQSSSISLTGSWKLTAAAADIFGQLPENQIATLNFQSGNSLTGFLGCNNLRGEYKTELDHLTIGPLMSTKKSCENMEVEMLLQRFLPGVGFYKVMQDKLYLYDRADRKRYLVFTRRAGTI